MLISQQSEVISSWELPQGTFFQFEGKKGVHSEELKKCHMYFVWCVWAPVSSLVSYICSNLLEANIRAAADK